MKLGGKRPEHWAEQRLWTRVPCVGSTTPESTDSLELLREREDRSDKILSPIL